MRVQEVRSIIYTEGGVDSKTLGDNSITLRLFKLFVIRVDVEKVTLSQIALPL